MSTRDAYENRTVKTAHPTAERVPRRHAERGLRERDRRGLALRAGGHADPPGVGSLREGAHLSEEVADRVAAGVRAAWQRIVGYVAGGSIYRTGGLLVTLTNLADQELQSAFVESPPLDAPTALADADRWVSD